jgi:hypothetical protein
MDKRHVQVIAALLGEPVPPEDWSGVDAVLPLLERMRSEGAVLLIKLDGERTSRPYTVFVSGGPLRDSVRLDANTLDEGLAHVLGHYAAQCWGVAAPG